jgi:DNA repair exonuclease SbcCD ATPase subunit
MPNQVQQKTNKNEWDLFNPIPELNLKNMSKNIDVATMDNPYIQVVWEDSPENFTQERIKSVKQYFQKKYETTNVNVISKIRVDDQVQQTVDVSVNIMDKNYQKELIKSLLEQKGHNQYLEQIMDIDNKVENRLLSKDVELSPFKKWYIKKIEFSNFLSYGEDQVLDFEKCNGITVVESDPPNFGGKTVLTVDLLLFLFFNTTTKTQKAEEIFNRFSNSNVVSVKGDILIDGEEYIIARKIERKKAKSGEWNVKTDLEFFKKLPNGELQNFTGEQRRETEQFIKTSIGSMDDFLMTILTTASNLEDLLESKPTARGQVLSRFLGLEFLKKKEETAKEIYSEYSKSMLSNVYNTEKLKQEIEDCKTEIIRLETEIKSSEKMIDDVDKRLNVGQEYKDNLLKSKFTDIDSELISLNPQKLEYDINETKLISGNLIEQIKNIKVVKPTEFYQEENHDRVKEKLAANLIDVGILYNKISEIESLSEKYSGGIQCEHCGIKLIDATLVKQKISELDGLKLKASELKNEIDVVDAQEKSFTQLKKEFDEYEKNKLIKEKYEVSLESNELKLSKLVEKLQRYNDVQGKIKKNNDIDAQLIKANLRIDELISEKRNYEIILTTNQNEIKNQNFKIDKNKDIIIKIAEEFEKERIFKIYLEIFGKNGISKSIMKTMMPIINSELQRLLEDSCYFNLEIRINEKNEVEFIMIDNSTGIEKLMTSGSGYEKTIAAMALRSVLSKICSLPKPNVVVWDEVFGKISNENLDLVGEFFGKIKDYFEKIFVISHNPMINNWANNVVKIKKIDNISKVLQ